MRCTSCSSEVPEGDRFCGTCGSPRPTDSEALTRTSLPLARNIDSGRRAEGPRFLPGIVLAGRYRIISQVGRGGMGEVYRADDLKLGQPVALKFIPTGLEKNRARHERLLEEVKLARQVSHPNVCRVYDVGEVDGQHFLSMEYVDGEDLASLLRRIGHLPKDKAVQIARQICAGLAAAHDEGILHRDLKPANVMIDGRGRAKISDFGLASLAGTGDSEDGVRGTLGYLAPEQLDGKEATTRSDIYALGLVLYELFTGRRAFDAATRAEMITQQRESTPATPSSHMDDFDPTVEKAILRCLQRDPVARPGTAVAVAAALPGGDPLAAALAAGETPPPEVVAAAGGEGALKPGVALAALAAALVGLILTAFSAERRYVLGHSDLKHPPEVMLAKAREIIEGLGYDDPPVDEAFSFYTSESYVNHIRENDTSLTRWDRLATERPTPVGFWYRRSPRPLQPRGIGRAGWSDPAMRLSGMVNLRLDASGRLAFLQAVPPQRDEARAPYPDPDWSILFEVAGLDSGEFKSVVPEWLPEVFCDERAAWTGVYPGQDSPEIRVEACSYHGRPVYFDMIFPWSRPNRLVASSSSRNHNRVVFFLLFLGVSVSAAFIARRNLRLGRGDRTGAFRVAAFFVISSMLIWFLGFDPVLEVEGEFVSFFTTFGLFLMVGMAIWLMYVAVEPFARRVWPDLLISWARLLSGRFRDPLVGKHFLLGALLGLSCYVLRDGGIQLALTWLGHPPPAPRAIGLVALNGLRSFTGVVMSVLGDAVQNPMLLLFILVLGRFVLRRRWLAAVVLVLLGIPFNLDLFEHWAGILLFFLGSTILVLAFVRFGLVGGIAAALTVNLPSSFPLTTDVSAWYFNHSLVTLALVAGLLVYAFRISLVARPPVKIEP